MRGVFMGIFALNIFTFVIVVDAFAAGLVNVWFPLALIASSAACLDAVYQWSPIWRKKK